MTTIEEKKELIKQDISKLSDEELKMAYEEIKNGKLKKDSLTRKINAGNWKHISNFALRSTEHYILLEIANRHYERH